MKPAILKLGLHGDTSQSIASENSLWKSLTNEQQQQVLTAYVESEDETNLISLSAIKYQSLKNGL